MKWLAKTRREQAFAGLRSGAPAACATGRRALVFAFSIFEPSHTSFQEFIPS
jgi:hypothetical protein